MTWLTRTVLGAIKVAAAKNRVKILGAAKVNPIVIARNPAKARLIWTMLSKVLKTACAQAAAVRVVPVAAEVMAL